MGVAASQGAVQTQELHELVGAPVGVGLLSTLQPWDERNVVNDSPVGQEAGVLHDIANGAAQAHRVPGGDVLAVNEHAPIVGLNHAVNHAQQRGLAAS